jgi:hypothetical protein
VTGKELRRLIGALLVGAAIAFPAGLYFSARDGDRQPRRAAGSPPGQTPDMRNFYSPNIADDPYVVDQQRRTVEALETECRHFREHCTEARQARRWLSERNSAN